MKRVLVTGANGFVGRTVCALLAQRGVAHTAALRARPGPGQIAVGAIDGATSWAAALAGCDTVIHLAARVHVMDDASADPLAAYRAVNVDGSLNLARQAFDAGVRRFVYVSSVKVNGELSGDTPFAATDVPRPSDPYGQSKLEAEQGLQALAERRGGELAIVRPPLVYGPGVGANFRSLMALVARGVPLPFASATARRSLVAVDNLADLLLRCASHPNAGGGTFMVSDGNDLTIGQLCRALGAAMDQPARLLPVPPVLLRALARVCGRQAVADRLLGALQVEIGPTCARLDWQPPVPAALALAACAQHYLNTAAAAARIADPKETA